MKYWLQEFVFRVDMAVFRFLTRLRCGGDGHPITWTATNGTSGCSCGKKVVR